MAGAPQNDETPLLDPLSLIQGKRREHRPSNAHQRRALPPVEAKAETSVETSVTRQWQKHCNLIACNLSGRLRVTASVGDVCKAGCGNSDDDPRVGAPQNDETPSSQSIVSHPRKITPGKQWRTLPL